MTLLAGQNSPTSGGTNVSTSSATVMVWRSFTAVASGGATSLNIYVNNVNTATTVNLGLYDNGGNLLAAANGVTLSTGLVTGLISSTPITGALTYSLAWQGNSSIKVADDGTTFKGTSGANTFASGMPSTLPSGGSVNIGIPSIYADGTTTPIVGPLPRNVYVMP